MDKQSLIFKHFQKSHLLTPPNPDYGKTLTSLFTWLTENDAVQHDSTTKRLLSCYHVLKHDNMDYHTARLVAKEEIIVAGMEEIDYLLRQNTKLTLSISKTDGQKAKKGEIIGKISGNTEELLAYERTIVNILQRMSGIATETNKLIKLIDQRLISTPQKAINNTYLSDSMNMCYQPATPFVAATRKTPWMHLDKKAVAVGGGLTHRLNLSDGILVKDNHIEAMKKTRRLKNNCEAIKKTLEMLILQMKNQLIEIEIREKDEAIQSIRTFQKINADNYLALLFDNFTPKQLKETIQELKTRFDLENIICEASGGIDEGNLLQWTETGVDILSLGALTHSTQAANLSLEF